MAVNDPTSEWAKHATARQRVADLNAGRDEAVKHIALVDGWDTAREAATKARAYYLPIVPRTMETFTGLVFLKAPRRTLPEGMEAITEDVTGTGQEIDRFSEQGFDAVLATGAICVVVDREEAPDGLTKAEAEARGYRPTLKLYDANSILDARLTRRNGDGPLRLSRVRVLETVEEDKPTPENPYGTAMVDQMRVLEIGDDDVYTQVVWRPSPNNGPWVMGNTVTPLRDGKPLDHIPAYFSNDRDGEPHAAKPPMADLADTSIAHLNNSASHEWALMWLGEPMLVAAGFRLKPGEKLIVGASEGLISDNPQARATILQADANSVGALREAMDRKEKHAASLGARMLAEETKAPIAEQTVRIFRSGETSVVGAIANAVSQCLTNALKEAALWAGLPDMVAMKTASGEPAIGLDGKPIVNPLLYWLNTDLMPNGLAAEDITAMLALVQAGRLSPQEFYARLQEAEWADASKSFQDHEEEIALFAASGGLVDDTAAAGATGATGPAGPTTGATGA